MQGIFQKENTDKALKYGIYRHLPTYEKIIRNLVSFYKENRCLHNGNGRGPDCHYWLCMENSLTLVRSVSLCKLIERRRNATS